MSRKWTTVIYVDGADLPKQCRWCLHSRIGPGDLRTCDIDERLVQPVSSCHRFEQTDGVFMRYGYYINHGLKAPYRIIKEEREKWNREQD